MSCLEEELVAFSQEEEKKGGVVNEFLRCNEQQFEDGSKRTDNIEEDGEPCFSSQQQRRLVQSTVEQFPEVEVPKRPSASGRRSPFQSSEYLGYYYDLDAKEVLSRLYQQLSSQLQIRGRQNDDDAVKSESLQITRAIRMLESALRKTEGDKKRVFSSQAKENSHEALKCIQNKSDCVKEGSNFFNNDESCFLPQISPVQKKRDNLVRRKGCDDTSKNNSSVAALQEQEKWESRDHAIDRIQQQVHHQENADKQQDNNDDHSRGLLESLVSGWKLFEGGQSGGENTPKLRKSSFDIIDENSLLMGLHLSPINRKDDFSSEQIYPDELEELDQRMIPTATKQQKPVVNKTTCITEKKVSVDDCFRLSSSPENNESFELQPLCPSQPELQLSPIAENPQGLEKVSSIEKQGIFIGCTTGMKKQGGTSFLEKCRLSGFSFGKAALLAQEHRKSLPAVSTGTTPRPQTLSLQQIVTELPAGQHTVPSKSERVDCQDTQQEEDSTYSSNSGICNESMITSSTLLSNKGNKQTEESGKCDQKNVVMNRDQQNAVTRGMFDHEGVEGSNNPLALGCEVSQLELPKSGEEVLLATTGNSSWQTHLHESIQNRSEEVKQTTKDRDKLCSSASTTAVLKHKDAQPRGDGQNVHQNTTEWVKGLFEEHSLVLEKNMQVEDARKGSGAPNQVIQQPDLLRLEQGQQENLHSECLKPAVVSGYLVEPDKKGNDLCELGTTASNNTDKQQHAMDFVVEYEIKKDDNACCKAQASCPADSLNPTFQQQQQGSGDHSTSQKRCPVVLVNYSDNSGGKESTKDENMLPEKDEKGILDALVLKDDDKVLSSPLSGQITNGLEKVPQQQTKNHIIAGFSSTCVKSEQRPVLLSDDHHHDIIAVLVNWMQQARVKDVTPAADNNRKIQEGMVRMLERTVVSCNTKEDDTVAEQLKLSSENKSQVVVLHDKEVMCDMRDWQQQQCNQHIVKSSYPKSSIENKLSCGEVEDLSSTLIWQSTLLKCLEQASSFKLCG